MLLQSAIIALLLPLCVSASVLHKRAVAFFPPSAGGGSELAGFGAGLGEPLNAIISGLSSPTVLTDDGFLKYSRSIGFSNECLGLHLGDPQSANLGDGRGPVNQTVLYRMTFVPTSPIGACLESLTGGNHFRMFRQNGPAANSGALFLAVSHEQPLSQQHTISANGYNIGRDLLVARAVIGSSFNGTSYSTKVESITGLLSSGSAGINHGIAQDGVVKLLTVTIN